MNVVFHFFFKVPVLTGQAIERATFIKNGQVLSPDRSNPITQLINACF